LERSINAELAKKGLQGSVRYTQSPAPAAAAAPSTKPASEKYDKSAEMPQLEGKTIYIKPVAPYLKGAPIASNIKSECSINEQLVQFIVESAQEKGLNVVKKENIGPDELELKVAITDAVSRGNAFSGHRKYTSIAGSVVKGDTQYYSFQAARLSGGGFFGAYKSSCSVLGRTVETMGNDVALWLATPVDNAKLGDAHLLR
jgi:hypothetical protein